VRPHLHDVVSVDAIMTFKPAAEVYHHFRRRLDHPVERTWLVSSNPWDVIGAKAAGLRAAWIKRADNKTFDPWGIEPDLIAGDFRDLAERLRNESER
jgi:2-haloacid dehalogenase